MKEKYIDNLLKDESNTHDEVSRGLVKIMLPRILYELISNQVLERKRLNDKEYVITVLRENLSKIKLPNIPVAAHEPLIKFSVIL
ncbi:hypothetical protein [Clostridium butyricum]|uniref:hypothetical protein n=1 Tax=Clostridium butyricum TaxID=1492 RepID=UPI0012B7C085|nr:hypothetical protein [Clostridium butyricum]